MLVCILNWLNVKNNNEYKNDIDYDNNNNNEISEIKEMIWNLSKRKWVY